jgi:chemotaxis protein CheD
MIQGVGQEQAIVVSLGELHVTDDPTALLVCFGIGSCIAFTAVDPVSKISGMAHFVLPDSTQGNGSRNPERFVDAGIPVMLQRMEKAGAIRSRTVFKMAGGAHMVLAKGFESRINIGERNIESARATAAAHGLRLRSEDVGGSHGRTVRLTVGNGKVTVSTVGGASYEL